MSRNELKDSTEAALAKLKEMAFEGCRKCHGRGYIGWNLTTRAYVPCARCFRRRKRESAKES